MEHKNDRLPIFTERFKKLQGDRSQTEFADFLEISRQTVGFYYNGNRVPDALTMIKIARKCGVSADWLLGLVDDPAFEADDRAISKATRLSGLSISILRQAKMSRLADILNLLIEQEFVTTPTWADTLEKYPSMFSKYKRDVLKGFEEEVQYMLSLENKARWETESDMKEAIEDEVKERRIREWAKEHYCPILTKLYMYLISWGKFWVDDLGEPVYFLANGEIQEENPLKQAREKQSDVPNYVGFPRNKMIDSAFLLDIQDNIRQLKYNLSKENQTKSK